MRAHEFIPHDQLLDVELSPAQQRARWRAWLWSELQPLIHAVRRNTAAARQRKAKPKLIKTDWPKPAKPKPSKPHSTRPKKPKQPRTYKQAQRRVAAIGKR